MPHNKANKNVPSKDDVIVCDAEVVHRQSLSARKCKHKPKKWVLSESGGALCAGLSSQTVL